MKKSIYRIITIITLVIAGIIGLIFLSSRAIIEISWLLSQESLRTAYTLMFVRLFTIPLTAFLLSVISIFHSLSGSAAERKNTRFIFAKAAIIFIAAAVAEYFLRSAEALIFAFFAGKTGKTDVLFGLDMAFYLFWLPLLKRTSLLFGGFFFLLSGFRFAYPSEKYKFDKISFSLALFCTLIFFIIFKAENITSKILPVHFIGFIEVYGRFVPFILSALTIFLFALIVIFIGARSKITAVSMAITIIFVLCAHTIWPFYLEKIIFSPNKSAYQEKFAAIHAENTRKAFAIDTITRDQAFLANSQNLSQILQKNFWEDDQHFLKAVQKNQEILPIFSIEKASPLLIKDSNNQINPYFITAREIDHNLGTDWDIKHFRNIFGHGAVIGKAFKFTADGYPDLTLKNLSMQADDPAFVLNESAVFFSDSIDSFAFVNSTMPIADFSQESAPLAERTYRNIRAVPVNPLLVTALTVYYRDSRFLLTDYYRNDTQFLLKRKPSEIVKTLLPMFEYGDPRLILHKNELWWELDAYSMSDKMFTALSSQTRWGLKNWLRSPLKAFVSAYSGEVRFVVTEPQDPHAKIAQRLFPKPFTRRMTLKPEEYLYPRELFDIQSRLLGAYHETNASSFYAGLNERTIARPLNSEEPENITFVMIETNNNQHLAMQRTYVPKNKNIFSARLLGYLDENGVPRLHLYEAASDLGTAGLAQAEAFLNQDQDFSRLATLWGQRGSRISSSDTVFYPTKDGGIYLRTIFLESESVSIPLATRFALINNTKVIIDITPDDLTRDSRRIFIPEEELSREQQLERSINNAYGYYLEAEKARLEGNTQVFRENVDKIGESLQHFAN